MYNHIRYVSLFLALALFTQCGKTETEPGGGGSDPVPYTGTVSITLTADSDVEQTKVTYERADKVLSPTWDEGDKLYLAAEDGGYLGCLTLSSGAGSKNAEFKGDIPSWTGKQHIHAYYLGSTDASVSGNVFNMDISSQDGNIDNFGKNLSFMHGVTESEIESSEDVSLNISLSSMTSVLYLNLASTFGTGETVSCSGAYATASLNLCSGELSDTTKGTVTLSSVSSEYYMAIIPGDQTLTFSKGDTQLTMKLTSFSPGSFYTSHGDAIYVGERSLGVTASNVLHDATSTDKAYVDNLCITNTGVVYSYVRVALVGNWWLDGEVVADWDENLHGTWNGLCLEGWVKVGDFYYLKNPVKQGTPVDTKLFESYTRSDYVPVSGAKLHLYVLVQNVDYDKSKTKVASAWGSDAAAVLNVLSD